MSPEQAQGKPVDARSDVFSFGVLLYELVTGRRPFAAETKASTMAAVIGSDPKPASEIVQNLPREMDRLIQRCLRKDPSKRWQTMADLKVALEELKEESDSGRLQRTDVPARSAPHPTRRLAIAGIILAAVALAAALLVSTFFRPRQTHPVRVALTTYPGAETAPSLSPDGKQVAFIWNGERGDAPDLYVKLIDAGEPLRLTRSPGVEQFPDWSPDGTQIAFLRDAAVWAVPALGGPEKRIAGPAVRSFDWHPNGDQMPDSLRTGSGSRSSAP